MTSPTPGRPFGRYRLLGLLGRGGMGEVHLALGPGVEGAQKRVAIKRLLPALAEDGDFVGRFLDEARLVVQLSHGNIVPVFEVGQVDGSYFLVMEYVDGLDLAAVAGGLAKQGALLPVPLALYVAHEVSRGLDYAHRKCDPEGRPLGIVHRDVSPHNVLVGFDGEVRLVDFGIAKAAGKSHRTRTGGLVGKFAYMSPEQALGYPLDARSDIFALGVVLHELLTGRPLFDGETDPEVLRKVQEAQVAPPSALRPEVPPTLDAAVLRALARDPAARFPTMAEFGRALARHLYFGTPAGAAELAEAMARLRPPKPAPAPAPPVLELEAPAVEHLPELRRETATLAPEELAFPSRRPGRTAAGLVGLLGIAGGGYLLLRPSPAATAALPRPEPQASAPVEATLAVPAPTPVPAARPVRARSAGHERADVGYLTLWISPASRVEIDGQDVGRTASLVRHPLSPGSHAVVVRNDLLGREASFDLEVAAGDSLTRRLDLSGDGGS